MPKKSPAKTVKKRPEAEESSTGRYVFDKKLGKVVKVSDSIPKVASKASGASSGALQPCGRRVCPTGPCSSGLA